MGRKGAVTLESVNARLKASNIGLAVIQRGNKLSLRGTLPPKPGSGKLRPSQQTIGLGVYANPSGLEYAEAKAYEYGALLAQDKFSWLAIEERSPVADQCATWIESFRSYAFQNLLSGKPEQLDLQWREQYWYPALKHLRSEVDLTADEIIKAVQKTKANSRSRQVACQRLKRFAEFAGINVDLKPYLGNYNPRDIKRVVPTDEEIEAAIDAMANPEWQWVAGMMATYGIRDHECWYASLKKLERDGETIYLCQTDGKTGERSTVPPLPQDWVERWKLYEVRRPDLKVTLNKQYGDRTGRAFKRQKVSFTPYSLRHAYAIRAALRYGFPTAVTAKWLGHDPSVYLNTYQRHISEAQAMDTYFSKIEKTTPTV